MEMEMLNVKQARNEMDLFENQHWWVIKWAADSGILLDQNFRIG